MQILKETVDCKRVLFWTSRFCLKNCPPNDLECTLSHYALEYKLLSLPFGIASNQDLIRLVAYTQDGVMHTRTTFSVVDQDLTLPFALRDENHKGVLFTTRPLREPHTYRMKVRALSFSEDGGIEYRTTFIVYIAVSAYPYWEHFKPWEMLTNSCFGGVTTPGCSRKWDWWFHIRKYLNPLNQFDSNTTFFSSIYL